MIKEQLEAIHEHIHPHVKELKAALLEKGFALQNINVMPIDKIAGDFQPRVCTLDENNVQHCFP
jgi:hypothetical protein